MLDRSPGGRNRLQFDQIAPEKLESQTSEQKDPFKKHIHENQIEKKRGHANTDPFWTTPKPPKNEKNPFQSYLEKQTDNDFKELDGHKEVKRSDTRQRSKSIQGQRNNFNTRKGSKNIHNPTSRKVSLKIGSDNMIENYGNSPLNREFPAAF